MAQLNHPVQPLRGNFELIEPLFYREFNEVDPIFPEWMLEKMPRNVNTNRVKVDHQKRTRDGWLYQSYNTKGKFCCLKCKKNGISEKDTTWSSAYTTVLFRIYYGPDTDENGDTWLGGWIQMKFFAQNCSRCDEPVTCVLDNERPQLLVKWLHALVASEYYGFPRQGGGYRGKNQNRAPHREHLCEACHTGWCAYRRQGTRERN